MEKKESKAVETTAPHPNKIGIKEGIGYMLGDAGNLFVLTCFWFRVSGMR